MKYYAVRKGRLPGIYKTWKECQIQIKGFSKAQFKSFHTFEEAYDYFNFTTNTNKNDINDEYKIVYTDGSCINEVGGYAYLILDGEDVEKEIYGNVPISPCTNQKAELYAIKHLLENNKEDIIIHTDSQYSISCLTDWYKRWYKNGWKTSSKKPVINKKLIQSILHLMENRNIKFKHVRAHVGIKYNERVDKLAKMGTEI